MTGREADDRLDRYAVTLARDRLRDRSFLLGDRAGFLLYLPVAENERDATLQSSKWYGASAFGQSFFESFVTWIELDAQEVTLDRGNQTGFTMHLDQAVRTFRVAGREVQECYFVPNGLQTVVMSLEGDFTFGIRPEFDMRYYQSFNSDFSSYRAESRTDCVVVRNHVSGTGDLRQGMDFFAVCGTVPAGSIEDVPPDERLISKTYPKDEAREKAIESVYSETHQEVPDEAPIWDEYSTSVYSPVRFRLRGPGMVVCAFGASLEAAERHFEDVKAHLKEYRAAKGRLIACDLVEGALETGEDAVDVAYAHVLTRFNDCLVVRDVPLPFTENPAGRFYAIFAGNKYFMDAWKRDENISMRALLATNDYGTVRAILDTTWQHQDERTGRLPHIIRVGEELVYYSSDGTLWALLRLVEYTRQSGDTSLLQDKLSMVRHFFRASLPFVQRGLLPSGGIIDPNYRWETWEDTPFTPRDGYPVEIELLWLSVLARCFPLVQDEELSSQMQAALAEGQRTFTQFQREGYLADRLRYDWTPDPILTPNGYLAFELDYPLDPELGSAMVKTARDQLAGRRGLRSLAPRDWPQVFPASFLNDPRSHNGKNMASFGIYNYHRGIEWEWLNSTFVAGELQHGDADHAYRLYTAGQVDGVLHDGGIGGLSELYHVHGQLGADFQAWSMAALIEGLHRYAGITLDAMARTIEAAPWLPSDWPYLRVRRRVGQVRFDFYYERSAGSSHRLRITPCDHLDGSYALTATIRLPDRGHIREATCNGQPVEPTRWEYERINHQFGMRRARLALTMTEEIDLRVEAEL